MKDLIIALKSDLVALTSKQEQITNLLSVDYSEEKRIEAVNLAHGMVPIFRDVDARLDGLLSAYNLLKQLEIDDEFTRRGQDRPQSESAGTGET